VESGYFLADERTTHGEIRADLNIKNDLILKAYDQYPVDVVNVSSHDLAFLSKLLKADGANASDRPPVLKRLVSANTIADSPGTLAPQPFLVRDIPVATKGEGPQKPIRVAFVGLAELSNQFLMGLKVTDPVVAAKRIVPEARRRADLVIVLAYGRMDEVIRIAREVPGIDVVIAGTGDMFTPPLRFGETLVAFTPFETRFLGELRFYRNDQGKFSTRERFISLDAGVGDDQTALKVAADVTAANLKAYKDNQAALSAWSSNSAGGNGVSASSTACAQCHAAQYFKWANSRHARASDILALKQTESDASCLACHASGLLKAGSLAQGEIPKLTNVQCEQCHGPGAAHIAKPAKGYGRVGNLRELCSGCHTSQTSPRFEVQTYWERIKH
jgi:hypothetical protein